MHPLTPLALLRRVPEVARWVAAIALLNGFGWALLTPAFQVPDETAHFAYVQRLAESGKRPGEIGRPEFSSEQAAVMEALRTTAVIGRELEQGPATRLEDARADAAIGAAQETASRSDGGGPSTASGQPPLYYLISVVPYKLTAWASLPTRLTAIRLLGALFLSVTAALATMLALEFFRRLWVGFVAGAAVALQPVVAFISAGVSPDSLLMLLTTALSLVLVRCFRLGLSRRRCFAFGGLLGAGLLTKLTFLAVAPPAVVALAWLTFREFKAGGLHCAAVALLRAAAPAIGIVVLFLSWNALQGAPIRPTGTAPASLPVEQQNTGALREELSYVWQLYLPRVPGQADQFGFSPPTETWLKGLVGRYGWLDYSAPTWMVDVGRWLFRLLLVVLLVGAVRARKAVFRRAPELLAMAAIVVALLVVIGHEGYGFRNSTGLVFEQARYVFPVVAIYGLGVAAATVACGRRAGPYVAFGLVALFLVHDLSGIFLTVDRYYGA